MKALLTTIAERQEAAIPYIAISNDSHTILSYLVA